MLEIISLVQRLQDKKLLPKALLAFCTLLTRIINRIVQIDYLQPFLRAGILAVEPECAVNMSLMERLQRLGVNHLGWVFRPPFLQLTKLCLKCSSCRLRIQASLIRLEEIQLLNAHPPETLIQVVRALFIHSSLPKAIMLFRFKE